MMFVARGPTCDCKLLMFVLSGLDICLPNYNAAC